MRGASQGPGLLKRFGADRTANTAVVFAFALLPIAMAAGAAVDLRRQHATKSEIQDATDAAVLAASKAYYGATGRSVAQREEAARAVADSFMQQALDRRVRSVIDPSWTLSHDRNSGEFTLTARAKSPAAFGGLFGISSLKVGAESAAASGERKLEIALVLDSTGSMAGSKMTNLRKAATNFVNTLETAASAHPKPDAVKISLVPYNHTVRIGAQHAGSDWMDREGRSSTHYENFSVVTAGRPLPASQRVQEGRTLPTRFELFTTLGKRWGGCVESRPMPYDVTDDVPSAGKPDTLYVPYFYPDEPDYGVAGLPGGERPNTYVSDMPGLPLDAEKNWSKRQQNIDKYAGPLAANVQGPNRGCYVAPVVRLTTGFDDVRTGVKNMVADGFTNVFLGLHWGWNSLSPQGPFSDGVAYGEGDVTKIIVLMTDGENTFRPVPGNPNNSDYNALGFLAKKRLGIGSGTDRQRKEAMDDRLKLLCENVKKSGIQLYTIRVMDGDAALLKGCASTADHYYNVENASQLQSVFDEIARSILQLRLSR